jgi:hypothetical protein
MKTAHGVKLREGVFERCRIKLSASQGLVLIGNLYKAIILKEEKQCM